MPHCENCGEWVSDDYVRVFGRNGTVQACPADKCGMTRDGRGCERPVRETGRTEDDVINPEVVES